MAQLNLKLSEEAVAVIPAEAGIQTERGAWAPASAGVTDNAREEGSRLRAAAAEHHVDPADPEFGGAGLRVASQVRLDQLVSLHRALALRRLGAIGPRTQSAIAGALRYVFDL